MPKASTSLSSAPTKRSTGLNPTAATASVSTLPKSPLKYSQFVACPTHSYFVVPGDRPGQERCVRVRFFKTHPSPPAGIVQVPWNEVSAMYARLFSGITLYAGDSTTNLDQSYVAYVSKPIPRIGSWGISWGSFNTTGLYREDTVALTYARNL